MAESIVIEFSVNTSALSPAIDLLQKMGQVSDEDVASFKSMQAESQKAFDKINTSSKTAVKSFGDVDKSVNKLVDTLTNEFMKGAQDALDEAGVSAGEFEKAMAAATGKTEVSSKSLKGQLRELKEQISKMDDAGEGASKRFIEMSVAAGKLEDQIGDTAARVKALSSDTANTDAAVQGLQAFAAGFQLVTGAQELFGDENKDVQKALVKLNAIMAITNSIQQLQTAFQKETILVQKLGIIQTKIAAGAQAVYSVAVGASTGAMKLFRIALLATGIGAIIGLLYLAADAMGVFGSSTADTTESLKEQADALEKTKQSLADIAEETEKARNAKVGGLDTINREIALLKAKGATEKEIFDAEQKGREKELYNIRVKYYTFAGFADKQAELTKQGLDKTNEIEAAKLSFFKKQQDEATKKHKESENKRLENSKKAAALARDEFKRNVEAEFQISERKLLREQSLLKGFAENTANELQNRLNVQKEFEVSVLKLIELRRDKELAAEKLTQSQINNINDKYNKEKLDKLYDFGTERANIIRTNNEEIEKENKRNIDALQKQEEAANEAPIANIDALFAKIADNERKAQSERLAGAEQRYKDGVSSLEQYEAERDRISKEGAKTEIGNEIKRIEAIIAVRKSQGEDVSKIEQQLNDEKEKLRQADLDGYKKNEAKKVKATQESAEQRKQIEQVVSNIAKEGIATLFEIDATSRAAALDNQLKHLEKSKAAELDNKNLTEQQKNDIDAKYKAKELQLKKRAFEQDKRAKKEQAIISGALAIIQAFAQLGPIGGAIASIGIVATTLFQVAKINASKFPEFKKGTKNAPAGYALVGEEGPEIVKLAGGEKIYKYSDSLKISEAWRGGSLATADQILSMGSNFPSVSTEIMSNSYVTGGSIVLDYDRLGEAVASKMPAPIANNIMMDENGFTKYIHQQNSKRIIRNARYKF
jgi:hypothetical protein